MNRLILVLAAAMLFSCQSKKESGFVIDGTLTGNADGGKVYLEYSDNILQEPVAIDSTSIVNGKFVFKGKVDKPSLYYIVIDLNKKGEEPDLKNKKFKTMLYVDNSKISYKADVKTLPGYYYSDDREYKSPEVSGSSTHQLYLDMNKQNKECLDTLRKLDERYTNEYIIPQLEGKDVSEVGVGIANEEFKVKEMLQKQMLDFIKEHCSSVVALDQAKIFLLGIDMTLTKSQIDNMVGWFKKDWEGTPQYDELIKLADAAIPMAIGEHYKDIEVLDREGRKVKLSSMIPDGQYVMLEFWASWCGPCRGEIPHLRHVHDKYKDFAIVSISVDDSEKDWQKALKAENMDWTQGRLVDGINGEGAKIYNIQGVPMCLILDKKGCFYRSNMRGAYLDAFLKDLYGR